MTTPPLISEFRHASVAEQAAATLRQAIHHRAWSKILPGEYELARRLGISRPSARAALARLVREGLVVTNKGCRTRLTDRRHSRSRKQPAVCILAPVPREILNRREDPVLLEMHAEFADKGIAWEEEFNARLDRKSPERILQRLAANRRGVCWLLLGLSAACQRWFEQSRLPVVVMGSCFPGIRLPSVDIDYRAIGWHAAGCIAKRGHRKVALIVPQPPLPGDLACRDGFATYVAQSGRALDIVEIPVGLNRSTPQYKLDRLLARSNRPTVIFNVHPNHTLTVLIHLLQAGLHIPQDVSFISRNTEPALEVSMPELTRYLSAARKKAHRTVRIAESLLAGQSVAAKPTLIIPSFVSGATLSWPPRIQSK